MSKKVLQSCHYKSTYMWWTKQSGLASRSTNFMMGVKRNHRFSGKPLLEKRRTILISVVGNR